MLSILPCWSGTDQLVQVATQVLEQHHRSIATGRAGYRPTRMSCSSGLIETRNGHAVLGIARNGPQGFRLGWTHIPTVAAAMPVVPVVAFQVERAANLGGQYLLIGQV